MAMTSTEDYPMATDMMRLSLPRNMGDDFKVNWR